MATRFAQRLREERRALIRRGRVKPALKAVGPSDPLESFGGASVVRQAQHLYELRRRRDANLGADLFSEPSWDILLYLFVAAAERRSVSVSCACRGAAAPETTALRWLGQLEEAGLVVRVRCDGRRSDVRLSTGARRKMVDLLKGGCPRFGESP